MNVGKTLFAQVMEFVPWKTFGRIVERHKGDAGGRTLNCADRERKKSTPSENFVCFFEETPAEELESASMKARAPTSLHPSQSIELTGKSGGAIQSETLLPVERLSLVCKRLIAAELDAGFVISPELKQRLLDEIPPLKMN